VSRRHIRAPDSAGRRGNRLPEGHRLRPGSARLAGEITGEDSSALELDMALGAERYVCSCCRETVAERQSGDGDCGCAGGWVPNGLR
jgi:hypothetical protein